MGEGSPKSVRQEFPTRKVLPNAHKNDWKCSMHQKQKILEVCSVYKPEMPDQNVLKLLRNKMGKQKTMDK